MPERAPDPPLSPAAPRPAGSIPMPPVAPLAPAATPGQGPVVGQMTDRELFDAARALMGPNLT
eukprot:1345953-Alexandrium_andersonii.AAC.1